MSYVKSYLKDAIKLTNFAVDVDSSCNGVGSDKCNVNSMIVATNETLTPPVAETCDTGYNDNVGNLTVEEEARRRDVYVFNQTEQLFKYMLGLITDEMKEGRSELRLVRLLKHCFKIFKKFSDPAYIPLDFGKDVQKAFLFLFREADSTNFKDISVDDFQIIERTLAECEKMAPPFKLIGRKCTTCANVSTQIVNYKNYHVIEKACLAFQLSSLISNVDLRYRKNGENLALQGK